MTSGDTRQPGTLGTFGGVFTPSVLTILGIILFLRLGYVVGSAGLARALVIIAIANSISVLTSISLSAIATNLRVRGGGDYYLISRTLGPEFGGSLGLVLFLAQAVSIAFYCIGFGEALSGMAPAVGAGPRMIAFAAVGFLFVLAWLGADWATRFQYGVMALLAGALVSFCIGGMAKWDVALVGANWAAPTDGPGFWVLFAIFFPAVTGFTQGVSMSGDLRDPGKSLPAGTFMAVGISILVYFGVAVIFAATQPAAVLRTDYAAMKQTARWAWLIDAGVVAATLSSAMASFLGAPRILQSLAADRIFPVLDPFAKGVGAAGNPRRGVLLAAAIALATIGVGQLNLIAPIVSMFFLISYGLLNYATYYEARALSPSFRPRFRFFHPLASLAGGLACLGVMLAIDLRTGIVAVALLFAIFQYVRRTAGPSRWADSRRSHSLQQIRSLLHAVAAEPGHARDWRPHILAMSNDPERRQRLLAFAGWIEGGSGFTTVVRIIEGRGVRMLKRQQAAEDELKKAITAHGSPAFPLVVMVPDLDSGLATMVQAYGVGPLKANTMLLNWHDPDEIDDTDRNRRFLNNLKTANRLGCNIVVLNTPPTTPVSARPQIDLWWHDDATGRLCLLLAHLIRRNDAWADARVRVMADAAGDPEPVKQTLDAILEEVRIDAQPHIIPVPNATVIGRYSENADLVLLPLRFEQGTINGPFHAPMSHLAHQLRATAMILAAEDIDLDAAPEEGVAGEMARTLDALDEARKKAEAAARIAAEAAQKADSARDTLEKTQASAGTEHDSGAVTSAAVEAEKSAAEAEKTARKAAKARAKAEMAEKEARDKGIDLPDDPESDR